jgi:SAM-dependent methyltransferase
MPSPLIRIKSALSWLGTAPMPVQSAEAVSLPPEALRCRVHGATDPASFLEFGRRGADDIRAALAGAGFELCAFRTILDFGVGCGRMMRWLTPHTRAAFFGSDIDAEAIAWCRANVPAATFSTNHGLPPLSYANNTFDFVYAISVICHLDETQQFCWLSELRRVARPGAVVMVTLHGESLMDHLPEPLRSEAEVRGFAFVGGQDCRGNCPDRFHMAYHTRKYVARWYPTFFRLLAHVPQGLAAHQDIVILQRV